jgi:hypothetical protein
MDILGDAGVGLLELKNLFGWEQTIKKALHANPVGGHFLAKQLESVTLGAGALDDFGSGVAGVGVAVGVVDLAERSARIVESTAKTEAFLFGGMIERPRLFLETLEVNARGDELFHIEVVEILTTFAEETVNLSAAIEIELI